MKIFIPSWQFRGTAIVHRIRGWSPLEEVVFLAVYEGADTGATVCEQLGLPTRVVSSAIFRLLRFGLLELRSGTQRRLELSATGKEFVNSDRGLPQHNTSREIGFNTVFEKLGGSVIKSRDVEVIFPWQQELMNGNVRIDFRPEDEGETEVGMADRVSNYIERNLRQDELLQGIETVKTVLTACHIGIDLAEFEDGIYPEGSSEILQSSIAEFHRTDVIPMLPPSLEEQEPLKPSKFDVPFEKENLLLSPEEHLQAFENIALNAKKDIFILSTFVAEHAGKNGLEARERIYTALVDACSRGVRCHLFFGTSRDDGQENGERLFKLRDALDARSRTRGRLLAQLEPVHSHTKLLVADDGADGAVAILGSCNWLSSPFRPIELSVVLDEPSVAAASADVLALIAANLSTASRSTQALQALARTVRHQPPGMMLGRSKQPSKKHALITFLRAGEHDPLLRKAAHSAQKKFICASNKVGANLVTGVLNAAEEAAKLVDDVRLYYGIPAGPLKKRHIQEHAERLTGSVNISRLKSPMVHAKFLLWDEDDIIVSSMNFASQNGSMEAPLDELGVHIHAEGLADSLLQRFEALYGAAPE